MSAGCGGFVWAIVDVLAQLIEVSHLTVFISISISTDGLLLT